MKQLEADSCLHTSEGEESVIIAVYVDDILICTETDRKMNEIKDLGELNSFPGVQMNRNADIIWTGQHRSASKVPERSAYLSRPTD